MKVKLFNRYLVIARSNYEWPIKYTDHIRIATNLFGRNRELHIMRKWFSHEEYAERHVAWLINLGSLKFTRKVKKEHYPNIKKYLK